MAISDPEVRSSGTVNAAVRMLPLDLAGFASGFNINMNVCKSSHEGQKVASKQLCSKILKKIFE